MTLPNAKRVYLSDHWQVLGDFYLERRPPSAIAAARQLTEASVRCAICGAWSAGIKKTDVAAYHRSA